MLTWIKKNRETFIGSSVIVLALLIFGAYFFVHYRDLRDTAWKNLFIAQQIGYAGNIPQAQEQLKAIGTSFGNTSAAPYATITQGDILFAQGKFKEAGDEYAKLASGNKDLAPFAQYSLGKCKEAAGDLAGAQAQYSDFLSKNPDHFMAPEVQASLARAQELAGAKDQAKATYEKIVLLYPETSWAMQAKAKLEGPAPKPAAAAPKAAAKPAPAKK
jgi:tetratricopeptide (TPR) repeat protein